MPFISCICAYQVRTVVYVLNNLIRLGFAAENTRFVLYFKNGPGNVACVLGVYLHRKEKGEKVEFEHASFKQVISPEVLNLLL